MWPRRSVWRSAQYFGKRVLRITATPHAVAAGVAAGAFASFTPYLGFHFIIAAAVALCLRGNVVASALGTAVGNPITFPFIYGATLGLGRFVLNGRHPETIEPFDLGYTLTHLDFWHVWEPLLWPMTVGGLILGSLVGLAAYLVTRWTTSMFRAERQKRLAERARRRARSDISTQAGTA